MPSELQGLGWMWESLGKPPYLRWDPDSPGRRCRGPLPFSSPQGVRVSGHVGEHGPGHHTQACVHVPRAWMPSPASRLWASLTPVSITSLGKTCRGREAAGQHGRLQPGGRGSLSKLEKETGGPSPPSCQHHQSRHTASRRPRPHWTDKETEAGRKVRGARVLFSTVVHAHATPHTRQAPYTLHTGTRTPTPPDTPGDPRTEVSSQASPRQPHVQVTPPVAPP